MSSHPPERELDRVDRQLLSLLQADGRLTVAELGPDRGGCLDQPCDRLAVLFGAILVTQLFMGIGAAVMYGFFLGDVDEITALFLVTGIPALSLIPVGFALLALQGLAHTLRHGVALLRRS